VGAEDTAQRSLRDPDRAGRITDRDVAEVSTGVVGGRSDKRVVRDRQVQWSLVIQRFRGVYSLFRAQTVPWLVIQDTPE
jgi:hypothetical protein